MSYLLFVFMNSSCNNDPFSCKDKNKYVEVQTYGFYAGSNATTTKTSMEVLYNLVSNPSVSGKKGLLSYKYFEVYGGINLNYNPEKKLLFVRSGNNGFNWPNVYINVSIENLKNFKVPEDFDLEPDINGNYIKLLDNTFIKEKDEIKINESMVNLVTNLCK